MLKYDNNIYLHFFDRELRNSISEHLIFSDTQAQQVLATALLMSNLPLYVSFSHMYESFKYFPTAIRMAFDYEKLGLLKMLTNMRNIDEFLTSRRSLYSFDKSRYLNYFSSTESFWPTDTFVIKDDTTTILRTKIFESIGSNNNFSDNIREILQLSLIKNRRNAITFSFFRETIQNEYNQLHLTDFQYERAITDIKENISKQYTSRYLGVLNGTIVTAIPGLSYYDFLAKDAFLTNYSLFIELLKPLYRLYKNNFHKALELRLNNSYQLLHSVLQWTVLGLHQITNNINTAISIIKQYRIKSKSIRLLDDFIADCIGLYDYVSKMTSDKGGVIKMQTRILVLVATQLELEIMLKKLQTVSPVTGSVGKLSYFTSVIGESLVYVVKCQMGQGGVGGSILTLEESIRILTPDFVIMGGIAWGANKKKQNIGDLIISTQVWDYDIERVNPDGSVTPRGPISPSSARLVQMFEVVCALVKNYSINFGLVASGSELLDNKEYVEGLKEEQPELIGGDMESAGMASVCSRKNVDWILVKGICDWGYNKNSHKKEYQQIAATNSAEAIVALLSQLTI